ncbi:TA system VapC family ribonuclease toxin [Nevskia soli]|uniref:TA system VapC family ribonuclease toxin n=1 Tax=Nevskia soli TaxID=418856 RepID=UPI0004A76A57|nr:TA system VapC family ribonuclease toxin [Nevskia soli]
MRALLDVNVLIALLDADHIHHNAATDWLAGNIDRGWASCPITQNGCVRILAQPRYPNPLPAAQVAERLATAAATPHHEFWADSVSLLNPAIIDRSRLLNAKQVTDAYLLALAVAHDGRFVTFDRAISLATVMGAQARHLIAL